LSKKLLVLVTIITLCIFTLTGCGLLDKLLSIKDDFKKEAEIPEGKEQVEIQVDLYIYL